MKKYTNEAITFTYTSDWAALYVDGKLVLDASSLDAGDVLNALGIKYKNLDLNEEFIEEVEKHGTFPEDEKDLNNMEYYK